MGFGEYSHAAHVALIQRPQRPDTLFSRSGAHPSMSPHGAQRESRDSEGHPDSLAIVFALDVSGSMGEIPRQLATHTLPDFMGTLLDAGVTDPQVCFVAVGHAGHDRAPLQVGQFESTESLIDRWLTQMWLEGGGVGGHESYELAMYFGARKMRLDCVQKRGRRGYFFLTGDVRPNPAVSHKEVQRLFGDPLDSDLPIRSLIEELQRSFEPFFLIAPGAGRGIERAWRDLLGDRVVCLQHVDDTAAVCAGLVALLEGAVSSLTAYAERLQARGVGRKRAARVVRALVPFAASIQRDGAPMPKLSGTDLPKGDPASGLQR